MSRADKALAVGGGVIGGYLAMPVAAAVAVVLDFWLQAHMRRAHESAA